MSVCCCSMAGTAACQHCQNNPMATDVRSNTIATDRIEAKPFGYGFDVCHVCGKPSTIGKPRTNADRIRAMTDEELAAWISEVTDDGCGMCAPGHYDCNGKDSCAPCWLEWLKQEASAVEHAPTIIPAEEQDSQKSRSDFKITLTPAIVPREET